jgi:hypothetical protein
MQKRLACLVMFSVTTVATALYDPGKVLATESEGYKSTSLAQGRFRKIEVTGGPEAAGAKELRELLQQTNGMSDVYVQSNTWAPGGSTGWHMHPGQSLVIVTAGTVTDYEGRDPECRPHVYTRG